MTAERTVLSCLVLAFIGAGAAVGAEEAPIPPRAPEAAVGADPWPGFRPDPWRGGGEFPLDALADETRWRRRAVRTVFVPPPEVAPPAGEASGDPGGIRESDAFRRAFGEALAAARDAGPDACLAALAKAHPETRRGESLLRRLAFAASVLREDRAAADSLFYRISWRDEGTAAARLAAWRALEEGNPEGVLRSLVRPGTSDAGEAAARAWARWSMDPEALPEPGAPRGAPGAAAEALLRLDAARSAMLAGDSESARAQLDGLQEQALPPAWGDTYRRLATLARGRGGDEATGGAAFPDREALMGPAMDFLNGRDGRAREGLDSWLAAWPGSPDRPAAYLYRAQLKLAEGDVDGCEADLRVAEVRGSADVRFRARIVRAFVEAGRGRHAAARAMLDELAATPYGRTLEPELLFDRARLERLAGDAEAARSTALFLEEAYFDETWGAWARRDDRPEDWTAPARVLAAPEARAVAVEPPDSGPWGAVLWGESYLTRTAGELEAEAVFAAPVRRAESRPAAPGRYVEESSSWGMMGGVGAGARASGLVEAGVMGSWRGLGVRIRGEGLRTQEPGVLPLSRRGGGEFGLSGGAGAWDWSVVGEARGRREDSRDLADAGATVGPVAADWRGGRLDARTSGGSGLLQRVQLAWIDGSVEARNRGPWRAEEQWLLLEGARAVPGGTWEGTLVLARMDRRAGDDAYRFLEPDLRLVRRFGSGTYVGVRAARERKRALFAPVAGVGRDLGDALSVWAATEPEMRETPFRETFVTSGDWNVPDFSLPAARRWLDLRGGLRWRGVSWGHAEVRAEWFRTDAFRTWREEEGLWVEDAVDEAEGLRIAFDGEARLGERLGLTVLAERLRVRSDGGQVPYVPTHLGRAALRYRVQRWTVETSAFAVGGRRDRSGEDFGAFLRLDAGVTYQARSYLEYSLRIENLTDASDRRWPGLPAYGRGIFGGVRFFVGG